jgi:small subunit ribosomal protein S6e
LSNSRVKLLLSRKTLGWRGRGHRVGERRRKSVRGCIIGPDLAVIAVTIIKKGEKEIAGITDAEIARKHGPKRANKIRKMFNLTKDDDVRKYVVKSEVSLGTKNIETTLEFGDITSNE